MAQSGSELPSYSSLSELLGRYNRHSLIALALLWTLVAGVFIGWQHLLSRYPWMWRDRWLWGTWAAMSALLCWDIRPRRDTLLAIVGLTIGLLVEWWGTASLLWTYFTRERPPAWILIAWPVATLAIDRLGRVFTLPISRVPRLAALYWALLPAGIAWISWFSRSAVALWSSWFLFLAALLALVWRPSPVRDLSLLVGGSILGWFLEGWGTRRQCWTYYSGETPPLVTCVAHGYLAIIASRAVLALDTLLSKWPARETAPNPPPSAAA